MSEKDEEVIDFEEPVETEYGPQMDDGGPWYGNHLGPGTSSSSSDYAPIDQTDAAAKAHDKEFDRINRLISDASRRAGLSKGKLAQLVRDADNRLISRADKHTLAGFATFVGMSIKEFLEDVKYIHPLWFVKGVVPRHRVGMRGVSSARINPPAKSRLPALDNRRSAAKRSLSFDPATMSPEYPWFGPGVQGWKRKYPDNNNDMNPRDYFGQKFFKFGNSQPVFVRNFKNQRYYDYRRPRSRVYRRRSLFSFRR